MDVTQTWPFTPPSTPRGQGGRRSSQGEGAEQRVVLAPVAQNAVAGAGHIRLAPALVGRQQVWRNNLSLLRAEGCAPRLTALTYRERLPSHPCEHFEAPHQRVGGGDRVASRPHGHVLLGWNHGHGVTRTGRGCHPRSSRFSRTSRSTLVRLNVRRWAA